MLSQLLSLKTGTNRPTIQMANSAMTIEVVDMQQEELPRALVDKIYYSEGLDPLAFLVRDLDPMQVDVMHLIIQWYGVMHCSRVITITEQPPALSLRALK